MNVRSIRVSRFTAALALLSSLAGLTQLPAAPAEVPSFEVELWMVELPPAATVAGPEALPGTGRLQLSSVDAATWLKSMGGEESAATHLILSLADAEDFSIELPKLGCTFQGSGMLEDGAVRFDLVAVDSPDRPLPDCTLNGTMSTAAPVAMGRASVKETSLTVSSDHTLVFTPADRGDGRQRLILWRTIPR